MVLSIEEFYRQKRFSDIELVTEMPHRQTYNLASLCRTDLKAAFNLYKTVELSAIKELIKYSEHLENLRQVITQCIAQGNKVFLLGCGASARLAMLLKRLYELQYPNLPETIVCVSAGGEVALIKAVEQFEDKAQFGIDQLLQQGYSKDDLLIGLSASGEAPFVLSAVEYAASLGAKPWLVFNNSLASLLKRNPKHIAHNNELCCALELDVGAMALAGSTRLQATTAMQIALGLSLLTTTEISKNIKNIYQLIENFPLANMAGISTYEAEVLARQEYILYKTNDRLLGLSLLADLTERAPTFNLPAFENMNFIEPPFSPFYLNIEGAHAKKEVWNILLGRPPFCLNWQEFPMTYPDYIDGFDLSTQSRRLQGAYLAKEQHTITWQLCTEKLSQLSVFAKDMSIDFTITDDYLVRSLLYKLLLNSHSTLLMGILGYFEDNIMLSLKPGNFKLVDRAIRYSHYVLLHKYRIDVSYDDLVPIIFTQIESLKPHQSIVSRVVDAVLDKSR